MENAVVESEYMSLKEIAQHLGVTYSTARTKVLPMVKHIRIGEAIRVRRDEFHRYSDKYSDNLDSREARNAAEELEKKIANLPNTVKKNVIKDRGDGNGKK